MKKTNGRPTTRKRTTSATIFRQRNALGRTVSRTRRIAQKHQPARTTRKKSAQPKTEQQFSALPTKAQEQWTQATHVIQRVRREGVSLTRAAKEVGIGRKTVVRLAGSALRKQGNGRYKAKTFDRLLRVLVIPSTDGLNEVAVRDSRTASKIASYSDAVQRFLRTGDTTRLRGFRKLHLVDATGSPIKLITNLNELMQLGSAGVLSFESLYARAA